MQTRYARPALTDTRGIASLKRALVGDLGREFGIAEHLAHKVQQGRVHHVIVSVDNCLVGEHVPDKRLPVIRRVVLHDFESRTAAESARPSVRGIAGCVETGNELRRLSHLACFVPHDSFGERLTSEFHEIADGNPVAADGESSRLDAMRPTSARGVRTVVSNGTQYAAPARSLTPTIATRFGTSMP